MKKNEPVTKIMTKNAITVSTVSPLREVATSFAENAIHHIPVVDGSKLKGMITYSDLLRLSFADAFQQDRQNVLDYLDETHKVTDVMTTDMKTLRTTDTVKDAAKLLCQGRFHGACVINDNGEFQGIVTSTDVIKYLLEQY